MLYIYIQINICKVHVHVYTMQIHLLYIYNILIYAIYLSIYIYIYIMYISYFNLILGCLQSRAFFHSPAGATSCDAAKPASHNSGSHAARTGGELEREQRSKG